MRSLQFLIDNIEIPACLVEEPQGTFIHSNQAWRDLELPTAWTRDHLLAAATPEGKYAVFERGGNRFSILTRLSDNGYSVLLLKLRHEQADPVSMGETLAEVLVHRIRSPFTAARGFAELLKTPDLTSEWKALMKGLNQVEEIVNRLEEFTQPIHPTAKHIFLKEVLEEAVAEGGFSFTQQRIAFDHESSWPFLHLNAHLTKKAMIELLKNAVDHAEGQISLRWQAPFFIIHHFGAPISKQDERRLFLPFFTTKARGLGLGLVMARKWLTSQNCPVFLKQNSRTQGISFAVDFSNTLS